MSNEEQQGRQRGFWATLAKSVAEIIVLILRFTFAAVRAWWRWAGRRTSTWGKVLAYGGPIAVVLVIIIAAAASGSGGDDGGDNHAATLPTQAQQATAAPRPTQQPKPKETPKLTWETATVTEAAVRQALDDLDDLGLPQPDIESDNVTFLSVIPDGDGGGAIVAIEFKPGTVLSETNFLTVAGQSTVVAMAKLFANSRVGRVKITAMADLIDPLGNDKTEFLTTATLNRETADQINWQGLADRQLLDNKHVFCIADQYIIRPLIYNKLKDTGCLTGASR